jgi:hypothetical protein
METNDFFRLDQAQWFLELKDYELSKNLQDTNTPVEKFEFDDIHF